MDDHANLTDQQDQSVQNSSQVPEDHADVVTATAEHGEERVAPWGSFQGAPPQPTVVFHVPDHRLDCTAPSQEFGNGSVYKSYAWASDCGCEAGAW